MGATSRECGIVAALKVFFHGGKSLLCPNCCVKQVGFLEHTLVYEIAVMIALEYLYDWIPSSCRF